VLFNLPKGVKFFKLSLKLVNKNIKVIKKGLSLRGLLTHFIHREVINYLYIRFILTSGYSI